MQINATSVDQRSIRQTWTLHYLTDVHLDAPDHAEAEFQGRLREIAADPFALWIGGGDYADLIVPGDKRFGSGAHLKGDWADHLSRLPDYYIERTVDWMRPIASKCCGLLAGNHEATIGRNYHRGVVAEIAARLGNPNLYLGDRGWAPITWRHNTQTLTVKGFAYHGWSTGRLRGRKAIQSERDLGAWDADVILLGHDHQPYADLWWTETLVWDARNRKWRSRTKPRAVINGGSWTYGDMPHRDLSKLPASEQPGQSWLAGKNFRPQAIANPVLLMHIDFGNGAQPQTGAKGRPMGYAFELRTRQEQA